VECGACCLTPFAGPQFGKPSPLHHYYNASLHQSPQTIGE
jgi:hypothetical protein